MLRDARAFALTIAGAAPVCCRRLAGSVLPGSFSKGKLGCEEKDREKPLQQSSEGSSRVVQTQPPFTGEGATQGPRTEAAGVLQLLSDHRKRQVSEELPVPGPAGVAQVVESAVQGQSYALGEVQPASEALSLSASQGGAFFLRSETMTLRKMREIRSYGSVGVPGG